MNYKDCLKDIQTQYIFLQRELVELRPLKITASSLVWFTKSLYEITADENSPSELVSIAISAKTLLSQVTEEVAANNAFDASSQLSIALQDSINSIIEYAVREGYVQ